MHSSQSTRANAGFTMVELLAVVIIIGILAAVAVPAYRSYTITARSNEATTLVPQIRLRQENYRLEFNQFLAAPPNPAAFTQMARGEQGQWDNNAIWNQIGFRPPTPGVYFQYQINSGTNATTNIPSNNDRHCFGLINATLHYPPGTGDTWYTICAKGDLRGLGSTDANPAMVVGMSGSSSVQRVFSNLRRQ